MDLCGRSRSWPKRTRCSSASPLHFSSRPMATPRCEATISSAKLLRCNWNAAVLRKTRIPAYGEQSGARRLFLRQHLDTTIHVFFLCTSQDKEHCCFPLMVKFPSMALFLNDHKVI